MSKLVYLQEVVTLSLDRQRCMGCTMCVIVCPQAVFSMVDGRAKIASRDHCMECGACAKNCPVEAISVKAGVGCAEAVLNRMLGRKSGSCCCLLEDEEGSLPGPEVGGRGGCC